MISGDSLPPKYKETGRGTTGGSDLVDLNRNHDEEEYYEGLN
jgi:hypothetical protein